MAASGEGLLAVSEQGREHHVGRESQRGSAQVSLLIASH